MRATGNLKPPVLSKKLWENAPFSISTEFFGANLEYATRRAENFFGSPSMIESAAAINARNNVFYNLVVFTERKKSDMRFPFRIEALKNDLRFKRKSA